MPVAFIVLGLFALVIGVRGTHKEAQALLIDEFTGERNFLTWVFVIGIIGLVGMWKPIRPVSRAFLILVVLALIVANKGFFDRFAGGFLNRPERQPEPEPANTTGGTTGQVAPQASTVIPGLNTPQTGNYPAGVGNNAWWGAGLAPATGQQAACPPGTTATRPLGWGNATRCLPS